MEEIKKLDPYSDAYKKAKLEDLVSDAVARKDKKALEWLQIESAKKENRTRNGSTFKVNKNITTIRAEYAKKYLNYKPKSKQSAETLRKRKQEKEEKKRQDLFAQAFAQLGE